MQKKETENGLLGNYAKNPKKFNETDGSFLQNGSCIEVAPELPKCRHCHNFSCQEAGSIANDLCRFDDFRMLRCTKNGNLVITGFLDPHKDPSSDDINRWIPALGSPAANHGVNISRFLLSQVGDQFCDLCEDEKEAVAQHLSHNKIVAWKNVQGVRKLCDVCQITFFNYHWTCDICGFQVCLDCYKARKEKCGGSQMDGVAWLLCANGASHERERLMLTQMIPGDSLQRLGKRIHEERSLWKIPQFCRCNLSKELSSDATNGVREELIKKLIMANLGFKNKPLSLLPKSIYIGTNFSDNFKLQRSGEVLPITLSDCRRDWSKKWSDPQQFFKASVEAWNATIYAVNKIYKKKLADSENADQQQNQKLPFRITGIAEAMVLYSTVPHAWLCYNEVLRITDPADPDNIRIFQEHWRRGQPVLVSNVTKNLNRDLWCPESFAKEFGENTNDLIDCVTGNIISYQPMTAFWDGFENMDKRLKDGYGHPMTLKLKDWPPGDDFAKILPTRFNDLMKALPLGEYTQTTGKLNLVSRLPADFVRSDFEPKMYSTYACATDSTIGTTNLHLHISDTVNVLVYVGIPEKLRQCCIYPITTFSAAAAAGCDYLSLQRLSDKGALVGAVWHIYPARDADKIRDFLKKVAMEEGAPLSQNHDPIHDQSWYLNPFLRNRLQKEYGLEAYTIIQYLGDAIFIPAGAPHQVRNLNSSIKIAQNFVSPENVSHSFRLVKELHFNQEDKLQIKNIVYHAVKDAIASLSHVLEQEGEIGLALFPKLNEGYKI